MTIAFGRLLLWIFLPFANANVLFCYMFREDAPLFLSSSVSLQNARLYNIIVAKRRL